MPKRSVRGADLTPIWRHYKLFAIVSSRRLPENYFSQTMNRTTDHLLVSRPANQKKARISARVAPQVKEMIDMAAHLVGTTSNQFMAQAAYQAAQKLIEQETLVRLGLRDTALFLDLLDNPPEPNDSLKSAVALSDGYRASAFRKLIPYMIKPPPVHQW